MLRRIWQAFLLPALLVVALALLASCAPAFEVAVDGAGEPFVVDRTTLDGLEPFATEIDGGAAVPMERVLYERGVEVVKGMTVTLEDGATVTYDWAEVAGDAWWLADGRLRVAGKELDARAISVTSPALLSQVDLRLTGLASRAAGALGVRAPGAEGAVPPATADRVALIFVDGLGYLRYRELAEGGLVPHLDALGEPLVGLSVYPPSTVVASAALLTGAPPQANGVRERRTRNTEAETLFDVAADAGLSVVAVEGDALSFNLRNAEIRLSGDRDGDGSTDDNVLANALAVLEGGAPDLLWVHFHGFDDAGHTYGPRTPEEEAKAREVDAAVGQLLAALPRGTRVFVFADHGMHAVEDDGRLGNHGELIAEDMFVPVFTFVKE